jgi:hypothetical protein
MSVKLQPKVYYDTHGKPESVLLSFEEFKAILDELEDSADLRALEKAMETSEGTIKLSDFLEELEADQA